MSLAINLLEKYSDTIDEKFQMESYVGGDYSDKFSFVGTKSIKIYTPRSVALQDYRRPTATSKWVDGSALDGNPLETPLANPFARFGDYYEVEDEVNEYTLTRDRSFALTLDAANEEERPSALNAMRTLGVQIREQVTPEMDRYTFHKWAAGANSAMVKTGANNDPTDFVSAIIDAMVSMDNALVPSNNRTIYLPVTKLPKLLLDNKILNLEGLGTKAVSNASIGTIAGMKVKLVPDKLLPAGLNFMIVYKDSVLRPIKIKKTRVMKDVVGIDGTVLEGRYYYDALVLTQKDCGVYVNIKGTDIPTYTDLTKGFFRNQSTGASIHSGLYE